MKTKKCNVCGETKSIINFYANNKVGGYKPDCKLCNLKKNKEYRSKNKEKEVRRGSLYRLKHKKEITKRMNIYQRVKRSEDPLYKLRSNISRNIRQGLNKEGFKKKSKTTDIIGCSLSDLEKHLNDNPYGFLYGEDNIDIDHIVPTSSVKTEEEIIKLNNWRNLQLLPSYYNRHVKKDLPFNKVHFEQWLKININ